MAATLDEALVHAQAGRLDACAAVCRVVLAQAPDSVDARHLLGLACLQTGNLPEALDWLGQAAAGAPDLAFVQANYGLALSAAGRHADAARQLRRAADLAPGDATTWFNLATVLHADKAAPEAAESAYREALRVDPGHAQARWNLAALELARGDWRQGWEHARARLDMPSFHESLRVYKEHAVPEWQAGLDLRGRSILVHPEGGFGDLVMMLRHVPLLARAGARVTVLVPPELQQLATTLQGVGGIIVFGRDTLRLPDTDFKIALFDLPRAFPESPGASCGPPYLAAQPARVAYWRQRLAALDHGKRRPRIGLVWAGRPDNVAEPGRRVPLELLHATARRHDALFVSLQKGEGAARLGAVAPEWTDLGRECHDFAETAALAAALDWVISSDTSVAHLLGALGLQGAILLGRPADWRWGNAGTRSPWYPQLELLRQDSPGDWAGVMTALDAALARRLAAPLARE